MSGYGMYEQIPEQLLTNGLGMHRVRDPTEHTPLPEGLADAVLEALPNCVAVLDHAGTIMAVNGAWRRFARENGAPDLADHSVGRNYLATCRSAVGPYSAEAGDAASGIQAVLGGAQSEFRLEYPCDSPTKQRWFVLQARSLQATSLLGASGGAVVSHIDITERRRLEQRTQEALDALLAMAQALVSPDLLNLPNRPDQSDRPDLPAERAAAPGTGEVTQRLAEAARRVLGGERIMLSAVDPETEQLRPLVRVGWPLEDENQWYAESGRFRLSDYLSPELITRLRAGEAILYDFSQTAGRELPTYGMSQQLLVAPLRLGRDLVGLLTVDQGATSPACTPMEQRLVSGTADLAALVLQRDQLFQDRDAARVRELALQETVERMDEFVATAGHDLRTPLTTAVGMIDLAALHIEQLQASVTAEHSDWAHRVDRVQACLEEAARSMDRLSRMVTILFDISRAQVGTLDLHLSPGDLVSVVRDQVDALRMAHPHRTIRLEAPGDDRPVRIVADADSIGQVVANYLTNALKYSADDQPVDVRVAVEGMRARACVDDRGPGLPPGERDRIWQRYYRAPSIRVQSGSSSSLGLGLHICKTIIEQHGGQLGVESAVGQGSSFWFSLPLLQPESS